MRTTQPDIPKLPSFKWGNLGGSSGAILDPGSDDWVSSRSSLGVYVVQFIKPFSSIPIVLCTPHYGGGGVMCEVQARSATGFTVAVQVYGGTQIDSNVMFAAFGFVGK